MNKNYEELYKEFWTSVRRFQIGTLEGDIMGWQEHMELWFVKSDNALEPSAIIGIDRFIELLETDEEFAEDWGGENE